MPKFAVYATVRGSKFLGEFEAKDADAAMEMASEANGFVSLCWQCSSECEDPEIEKMYAEQQEAPAGEDNG